MSKYRQDAKKRAEKAAASLALATSEQTQVDSQATLPGTPQELRRQNAMQKKKSGSTVDLTDTSTPSPKTAGDGATSQAPPMKRLRKVSTKDAEAFCPDNQEGLEGSQYMPQEHRPCQQQSGEENEEQHLEPATSKAKAKCKSAPKAKATAAKSKARKTIAKRPQAQQEAGTSAKGDDSRVKRKALAENKENTPPNAARKDKVNKKPAQSKADNKPLREKKTRREQKEDEIDKSPAEDATFRPDCNPGGPASGSGKARKQEVPQEEKPGPNATSDIAASLARANTTDIEDKEAKRKAYKARKQRFYNSLNSNRTPDVLRKKAAESKGCPEEMQKLYEEWLSSNEQWQSSSYVIQLQQSHKFTKLGARRWMTFREISAKYSSDEIAQSIVDEKKANRQLAATQIKKHPDCPKREDMTLYLVWDSESETTKDCTLLSSGMSTVDDDTNSVPCKKQQKSDQSSSSSSSFDDDDNEDEADESDEEESARKKKKSKGKANSKGKNGNDTKKKKKKGKKNKNKKVLTEAQKKKNEEKEQERLKKKEAAEKERAAERERKKAYQEKVADARKVMNQLTAKIADTRSKMEKSKRLNPALAKAMCTQIDEQRIALQQARDTLQMVVDNFEEKKAKTATAAGEAALKTYQGVLNSMKV